MEITTLGGIIGGLILIIIGIVLPGADLMLYWDPSSLFITLGGAFAATAVSYPMNVLKNIGK